MEWSVTKAVKGSIFLQIFSLKYSLNRMLPTHTAKELFMEMQLLFKKKNGGFLSVMNVGGVH